MTDGGNDVPVDGGNDAPAAANGAACTMASDCASSFCADGVCCETACAAGCTACSNAKTGQASGLCRPVSDGTDPDNECAQQGADTCGTDGLCNGAGACRLYNAATQCAAAMCSGSTATSARNCNGNGTCNAGTTTACGTYACNGTVCRTTCASSSDCALGNICSSGACVAAKANGAACGAAGECASLFCVDGICCESACVGACVACASAKTSQPDGICRAIPGGSDPDNECTPESANSCGRDGMCDGIGACRRWAAGTSCGTESCTGTTYTPARTCDGAGTCPAATTTSCGAYACGATTCRTTCASNNDCAPGGACIGTVCVAPKANGAVCVAGSECASGSCVDGVCCETACTGSCSACAATMTGAANGLCRPVTAGTDPGNECPQESTLSCGFDGFCDGAGACHRWAAGTTCVGASCTVSTYTPARTCDGAGTCQTVTDTSCGMYMCGATSCATSCTTASDCTAGNYCPAGSCVPKETNGTACIAGSQCASGNCVDGFCCNTGCAGTCQTCAQVGSVGTCTNADAGTNPRNECAATAQSTCGDDGFCDGGGACRKWAAGTVCLAAACANATVTAASTCSGAGVCNAGAATSCGAYKCDTAGSACRTTCAIDADCGGFCSATACFAAPLNIAGNGDLEYGTTTAWTTNGGGLTLQTAPSPVQAGTYSVAGTTRTDDYNGPGYLLPTGSGQYAIDVWAMQNDNPTQNVALQVALQCGTSFQDFPSIAYDVPLTQGVWRRFTGTVDIGANVACQPGATPTAGVVSRALLYLNQVGAGTPVVRPNLFLDSLVVTVPDGHNLVGNPNFEATLTNGWENQGAGGIATTTSVFRSGAYALGVTLRNQTYQGPKWNLPLGAGKYNVTFHALHNGALPHNLVLQPTYSCLNGPGAQYPAPLASVSNVGGNGWNKLTGTVTFPPANATPGCKLTSASIYLQQEGGTCGSGTGQIECPDLFIDDVSITLAP